MSIPPGLDPEDLNTDAELDSPHEGQHHGETHTRRPQRGEGEPAKMQGVKTRARNREIVKGRR